MFQKTIDIISKELSIHPNKVQRNSRIVDDLDVDRADLLTIVTELEDEYDIIIDYNRLGDFVTVGDLQTYVESKI
ncbi:MAG: acyl carrier protein [Erysipelotrichaceae bacterium]|nr:acyl carrier protein [Erysipelotrichaceae bacterium]